MFYCSTRVNQRFCIISVTWETIRQLRIVLPRSWRWQLTLDRKIPSSPDTLRELIATFTSMAWSLSSESMQFGWSELVWSSRFLEPFGYSTVIDCAYKFRRNIFGCFKRIKYTVTYCVEVDLTYKSTSNFLAQNSVGDLYLYNPQTYGKTFRSVFLHHPWGTACEITLI